MVPGIGQARRQPRAEPLSPTPPRHPPRASPPVRTARQRRKVRETAERIGGRPSARDFVPGFGQARQVAHGLPVDDQPAEKAKRSFISNVLSSRSPVGQGIRQNNPVFGVLSTVAARAAFNVGKVLFGDPAKQGPKLLRDTGESIVSIPSGLVRSVTDPGGAVKALVKDYDRRYRPLLEGDDETFRKRMEKEGVAPEVFDLAGLAGAEGAVAGRAFQSLAKAGQLGKAAERIATTRPALQVSGGTVKSQPLSNNFFRNVVRAGVDKQRARVQSSRAARPEASALVREAEEQGNVTRIFRQGKPQARDVAAEKGRKLQGMKAEQQAEVRASEKAIGSLSKPEQRAFKYAMQYGATTPEAARRVLTAHRERIAAQREAHEAQTGRPIPKRQNELPEIDYLLQNADKAFTPRLAEAMRQERGRAHRAALQDPAVDLSQAELRRHKPLAELLGVARHEGESNASFLSRVDQAAKRAGVEAPGYFPSEKRAEGVFSAFAVGGRQAVKEPGRYTGALTQTGRESGALDVFLRGIARNIKRKYNWNLVADNFDRHAYSWSKNKTIEQLKDEMERRGIDPKSVAFWNPKKFREEQQTANTLELEGRDVEAGQVSPEAADVHGAAQLATNPAAFKGTSGWSLIPKAVHDEIMQDIRPSGALGRGFDIAKGKMSRVLLGNPAWLQFQVGSNALLSGLAGTGPVDMVKAQVWWRKLPEEQKRAIEPYIGVHRWYDDQTRLGAATNNRMVNTWRAFKETGLYRAAHKANPFDALFRADNAQNNFFRKAVFYNKAKRETYKRMGRDAGQIMALQKRAMRILTLPPDRMMDAVIRDAETFERLAEHTNKFLGDYTTYTAKERRVLGRSVMFYGFLRYSVKFTLYTMPVEHPIVSSILTQIGRLERDEQKKIFGADVPPWELGNLYTEDGKKFALARLNPFFNASQWGEPGSLTASLSPLVQVALNQAASKDVTFQRPFTIGGSGQYVEKGLPGHPVTALVPGTTRSRILAEQLLRLSPYYRIAEKTGIPGVADPLLGKQTSESGLLWPDPVTYKRTTKQSEEAHQRNERTKREQAEGGAPRDLREQLLPLLGQQGQDVIRKAREFEESERKKKRKGRKKPKSLFDEPGGGGDSLFDTPSSGGKSLFG